jgi:hypothetical protein
MRVPNLLELAWIMMGWDEDHLLIQSLADNMYKIGIGEEAFRFLLHLKL